MLPGYEHDTTSGVDKRILLESGNGTYVYVTGDVFLKSSMKLFHLIFIHSAVISSVLDSNIRIKSINRFLIFSHTSKDPN